MIRIIDTERIPIKLWLDDVESSTLQQAKNLANLPFAFKHVALMPDCHTGFGMPIGGVLATIGVVIPNAVGVDIGCGMCAVKTSLTSIDRDELVRIMDSVRQRIPVGFKHQKLAQNESLMPRGWKDLTVVSKEFESARKQLGTLGGGNHFIEIQKGDDDHIWLMVHSGSRNLGYQVAKHYNNLAAKLNKGDDAVPASWALAYLKQGSEAYESYLKEMNYCIDFAFANRKAMMTQINEAFREVLGNDTLAFGEMINIAHNYARVEQHFGENVIVHRKGATSARKGEIGIIPGSQGTHSYIVEGLGNPESFQSCSHGAGRTMSRTQARKELDLQSERKKLDKQGILHSMRSRSDLDEATSAYKDIDVVMAKQSDLVNILVKLRPLAVIKG